MIPLMSLMHIVITLLVVGVLLWLVNTFIPMDSKIKSLLNGVVVISVVIWLLYGFGVFEQMEDIQLPRMN